MFAMKRHCPCKPCRRNHGDDRNHHNDHHNDQQNHSRMHNATSWAQDAASVMAERLPKPPMPIIDIPKTVVRHKRRNRKGPMAVAENLMPKRKKKHTAAKIVTALLVAALGIGAAAIAAWWQQGA